jgi:hypothetical protein
VSGHGDGRRSATVGQGDEVFDQGKVLDAIAHE